MGNIRESFPILEDIDANNEGVALSQAIEGDTKVGRNFHGVLPAVDALTGNILKFLRLDPNGALIVNPGSTNIAVELTATDKYVNLQNTEQTICEITLQPSTDYSDLEVVFSCFRECLARIIAVDDASGTPVETELVSGLRVGPGQYTFSDTFDALGKFTSGSTGVQKLRLRAYLPHGPASGTDVDGALGVKELQ